VGERDGRIALYLTDHLPRLWRPADPAPLDLDRMERHVVEQLGPGGAMFFPALHAALGGGFARETVDALWRLVWRGLVTNDTFHALRAFVGDAGREAPRASGRDRRRRHLDAARGRYRSRRTTPPAGEGRWSLTAARVGAAPSVTEWSAAVAQQLLQRYGVVTRESVAAEWIPGGFGAVYDVLKAMEDAGRIRRGYFATGVGAAQFALPAALERLRALREEPEKPEVLTLAATDPANPYGAILKWPETPTGARTPMRSVGATVIVVNGACAAYLARGGRALTLYLPDDEPARSQVARAVAGALAERGGVLLTEIDGTPAGEHPLAPFLVETGFALSALGFAVSRRIAPPLA
jgi:ATP-dependent Lhr-like helicase